MYVMSDWYSLAANSYRGLFENKKKIYDSLKYNEAMFKGPLFDIDSLNVW